MHATVRLCQRIAASKTLSGYSMLAFIVAFLAAAESKRDSFLELSDRQTGTLPNRQSNATGIILELCVTSKCCNDALLKAKR